MCSLGFDPKCVDLRQFLLNFILIYLVHHLRLSTYFWILTHSSKLLVVPRNFALSIKLLRKYSASVSKSLIIVLIRTGLALASCDIPLETSLQVELQSNQVYWTRGKPRHASTSSCCLQRYNEKFFLNELLKFIRILFAAQTSSERLLN